MKRFDTFAIKSAHQGLTVEEYLKDILKYSGRKIQKLTRMKGILLNKRIPYLQKKVKGGDVLSVLIPEDKSYGVTPQAGPLNVLYHDNNIIVLDKPPLTLVHPTGYTARGTLANYLAGYLEQQGEICKIRPLHRLDRDTSGCVIFAKDAQTQSLLEEQLRSGQLKRIYYAVIEGAIDPPSGTIDVPVGPHPSKPNRRAVSEQGETAVTHYRTLQSASDPNNSNNLSLLELSLETGRTHQIRVHLAHYGHPILGDKMYGKASSLIARQALHSSVVRFIHPANNKEIEVQAPLPFDIEQIVLRMDDL